MLHRTNHADRVAGQFLRDCHGYLRLGTTLQSSGRCCFKGHFHAQTAAAQPKHKDNSHSICSRNPHSQRRSSSLQQIAARRQEALHICLAAAAAEDTGYGSEWATPEESYLVLVSPQIGTGVYMPQSTPRGHLLTSGTKRVLFLDVAGPGTLL